MRLEYSFLATLIGDPSLISAVSLKAKHFEDQSAARLYEAVIGFIANKKEPDVVLLAESLGEDKNWIHYITNIVMNNPTVSQNIQSYETEIKKAYRHRQEERIAQKFLLEIRSKIPEAATNAIMNLHALDEDSIKGIEHVKDVTKRVLEKIDERQNQDSNLGIKTGITSLDDLLGGLQPGDYTILAARTSVGKTATMLNFALNADCPVGIISAEQTDEQLTQRMLANLGRIKSQRFRTGNFKDHDYPKLSEAVVELTNKPIYIAQKHSPSIQDIEQIARQFQWKHGIKILFIDYIQKIRSERYKDRHLQVGDVSRRLFALAKELNIPVVVLAQLNRNADGKEPRLSDLRESGDIEQDADQIIFLHKSDQPSMLDLIVAKNRFGPIAHTKARWEGEHMRLTNP